MKKIQLQIVLQELIFLLLFLPSISLYSCLFILLLVVFFLLKINKKKIKTVNKLKKVVKKRENFLYYVMFVVFVFK